MDEEAEDEGDVEEEEKNHGQEGLDLDLVEDEGSGSQDEQEAEKDVNVSNVDHEKLSKDDGNNDTVEDALPAEGNGEKVDKDKEECNDEKLLALPPHGIEVFVGNILWNITKEDLTSLCEQHGEVFYVSILFVCFMNFSSICLANFFILMYFYCIEML
jgi:RNA recognition motif-containing protein